MLLKSFGFSYDTNLIEVYQICFFLLNPFVPNAHLLYPMKTSENLNDFLMFSWGREKVHWEQIG